MAYFSKVHKAREMNQTLNYFKFFTHTPKWFKLCVNRDGSETTNFQICTHSMSLEVSFISMLLELPLREAEEAYISFLFLTVRMAIPVMQKCPLRAGTELHDVF
jgi:hypothetical protein